jgi:hypothetical protein
MCLKLDRSQTLLLAPVSVISRRKAEGASELWFSWMLIIPSLLKKLTYLLLFMCTFEKNLLGRFLDERRIFTVQVGSLLFLQSPSLTYIMIHLAHK